MAFPISLDETSQDKTLDFVDQFIEKYKNRLKPEQIKHLKYCQASFSNYPFDTFAMDNIQLNSVSHLGSLPYVATFSYKNKLISGSFMIHF
jgi:hypothetical protein